jgi:hypothetical protein
VELVDPKLGVPLLGAREFGNDLAPCWIDFAG